MDNNEFLTRCGLTEEWGIRRPTLGDAWYDSKALAEAIIENDETLIHRWVSPTWEFSG